MPSFVRQPYRAGSFYPSDPLECRAQVEAFTAEVTEAALPPSPIGGIVPHAGWIFSGKLTGSVWGPLGTFLGTAIGGKIADWLKGYVAVLLDRMIEKQLTAYCKVVPAG